MLASYPDLHEANLSFLSKLLLSIPILVVAFFLLLPAERSPEGARDHLASGLRLPDARISLTFPQPMSITELFPLYDQAAELGGYNCACMTLEEAVASSKTIFSWTPLYFDPEQHRIAFMLPRKDKSKQVVHFIFYSKDPDPFSEEEWQEFARWESDYLPQVFPQAEIQAIENSTEFTNSGYSTDPRQSAKVTIPTTFQLKLASP
ncbi:MAG: hypothetical protein GDA55_04540 [Cellvibrionales bacterium]|nr:hypothetical protein [Cellvibrionales bacterium]